jgi:23S rRNA pseudouridine1911/1915/1917 synthase
MAVTKFGRTAVTDFKVIERFKNHTLCEFSLLTGRTHQIRVHSKYIGHPIVGDLEYGYKNQKFNLDGQLLHATELRFVHPTSGKTVKFTAPLPEYFENILKRVRK